MGALESTRGRSLLRVCARGGALSHRETYHRERDNRQHKEARQQDDNCQSRAPTASHSSAVPAADNISQSDQGKTTEVSNCDPSSQKDGQVPNNEHNGQGSSTQTNGTGQEDTSVRVKEDQGFQVAVQPFDFPACLRRLEAAAEPCI